MKILPILSAALMLVACSHGTRSGLRSETGGAVRDRTAEFYKCMDEVDLSAFKNSQWNDCIGAELSRAEAKLQSAYRKLETSLSDQELTLPDADPDLRSKLSVAQISWRKFRDDYCEFDAGSGEAPNPEYNRLDCLVDLTQDQAKRLEGDF